MSQSQKKNIILFSVPRSGSTWLSEVLTHDNPIRLVHEPDNELNSFFGLHHKVGLNRYPFLTDKDEQNNFKSLFEIALSNKIADQNDWQNKLVKKLYGLNKEKLQKNLKETGVALDNSISFSNFWHNLVVEKRSETRTLLKTVHASLAIPFLIHNLKFIPVILRRHPLNTYSSYVNMDMPDGNRELYKNDVLLNHFNIKKVNSPEEMSPNFLSGYQLGIFEVAYRLYEVIPEITFINYEQVISNPFEEIESICKKLEIQYTKETKTFMESKFKTGKGYNTNRDLKGHDAVWKKRLTNEQIDEFLKGYEFAFGSINFEV